MSELVRLKERVTVRNDTLDLAIKTYNDYMCALGSGRSTWTLSPVIVEMMNTLRHAISELKIHLADAEQILAEYKLSQK